MLLKKALHMVSFVSIKKLSLSFKNVASAINNEAECCLDPENRKKKHNIARYTGDQ